MATLALSRLGGGIRRAWQRMSMRFSRPPAYQDFLLPRSAFDYASAVGDGTGSSVVMAPLLWICRTFPEAPVAVWKLRDDGQADPVIGHPMARLLARPNRFFSGEVLWMATLLSWWVDGNAYWLKLRNGTGAVAELWWVPHWMVEPLAPADGTGYVSGYAYNPGDGNGPYEVDVADIVHFRFGLDPTDMRKGFSPLRSVLREVFTDDEAANFTATLLRNMGVPGLVFSPADSASAPADEEDLKRTKAHLRSAFTGDNRGEPIVFSAPTRIEQFGFSPEQLQLRDLRQVPEERVSAVLGVPAIVAGLGAGLARSTFTNMAEAREMAFESNIIPSQRMMAAELNAQLLPEFESEPDRFLTGFDISRVRVLQEDRMKQVQRVTLAVGGGLMKLGEGRREIGLPATPDDDIYLRPVNLAAVRPGEEPSAPAMETSAAVRSALAGVRREAQALEALFAGASANGHGGE